MKFHKNLHIVALFAAMIALGAQAAEVSSVQVRRAVSAWAAANSSAFASLGTAESAKAVSENGTNLYWMVKMSNGGTVIASPDTDFDLVVAVLENFNEDAFPVGHPLPSILKADMLNRISVVKKGAQPQASASAGSRSVSTLSLTSSASVNPNLSERVRKSVEKSNAQWAKYGNLDSSVQLQSASLSDEAIAPYVRRIVKGFEYGGRFTHWDQGDSLGKPCYNYYTPEGVVCGCVATAGAAIMQFFGCAEDIKAISSPNGKKCYFHGEIINPTTIPGAIDWSSFANISTNCYTNIAINASGEFETNVYSLAFLLDDAAREVAGRVTYNLGVLAGMGWATEFDDNNQPIQGVVGRESGAVLSELSAAFKAYGFETSRHVSFSELIEGTSQYFKMIYAQNWAGVPVALGINGEDGGHAVIACGYAKTAEDEDYCRIFMGWGGFGDSWYKFPDIEEYSIIVDAVTMIGYDVTKSMDPADVPMPDDIEAVNDLFNKVGTVPVYGKATVADTVLTFPGVVKTAGEGEEALTYTLKTPVDSNGYFAVRIPANTENLKIVHEPSGTEQVIAPFDSKVISDESSDRDALEAAMPSEMVFLVLNTVIRPNVETGRGKACEDGKALLMISGGGSMRESALIDYITYLDSTTDMSNRFVIVRVSSSDDVYGDGDPSIGVFDPTFGDASLRWWESNGRLSYENFIIADESQTKPVYTFSIDDTTALTNDVNLMIEQGYDAYSRRHSGIVVEVSAYDPSTSNVLSLATANPEYGKYENCWTNGESAKFSVPLAYTNTAKGIVYSCLGWTTNSVSETYNFNYTNELDVVLATDDKINLVWLWNVSAYRVAAKVNMETAPEAAVALSPSIAWVYPGDRATIVATNALFSGVYGLYSWEISAANRLTSLDELVDAVQNGTAFSFTVNEPVNVLVNYEAGAEKTADPEEFKVELSIQPKELEDLMYDMGAIKLGENTTLDPLASFAAQSSSIIDSTGGVWKCTGWVVDGVTNSPSGLVALDSQSAKSIELVWELQEPEIVLPVPGEISIKGLEKVSDSSWRITITGAVKDCWYWLYSSDDISKLSGSADKWTADVADKKKAANDEDIVFDISNSGGTRFWRARVTATESGK